MKSNKLSKRNLKTQRRKIKPSDVLENKFLTTIAKILNIKLPKDATIDDVKKVITPAKLKRLNPYIHKFSLEILKNNRKGFDNIVSALLQGETGNSKIQKRIDEARMSQMQEEKMFKPLLQKFSENVKLIKNIPDDVAKRLEAAYAEGVSFRGNEIEKYLKETLGRRAKLIVRTESSKLNAAITEVRAKNVGINAYIWSTSEDKRVRPSHKAMDGVLVFWNDLPTFVDITLHGKETVQKYGVGETYNCRCVAIPIVEIDDIQFPVKVASNAILTSKYIGKGKYSLTTSGIKSYTKNEFIKKYDKKFN